MYRIGIDLGGTNVAAGIVDEQFKIIEKMSIPTNRERPNAEVVADIGELLHKLCAKADVAEEDIDAVGIASPGTIDDEQGMVIAAYNLNMFNFAFVDELKKHFKAKAYYMQNDANAAAWGEAIAGAAKGSKYSVMITLGTGVGGGVICDGKIYNGFNKAGAELGHTVIQVGGRPCTCGRYGCWETYSSATGLIKTTKEKIDSCIAVGRKTVMTELVERDGKVNGRTAFEGKRLGDEAASEVVEEYIRFLAAGLTDMINVFQPEVLSIGGGISNEGDYLLNLVIPEIAKQTFGRGYVKPCSIRIAQLKNDAGIIGAAVLGL